MTAAEAFYQTFKDEIDHDVFDCIKIAASSGECDLQYCFTNDITVTYLKMLGYQVDYGYADKYTIGWYLRED